MKQNKNFWERIGEKIVDFWHYVTSHWMLLILVVFTGTFTAHAAWFYTANPLYVAMTLILTEGFFLLYAHWAEGAIESGMADNKLDGAETTQIIAACLGAAVTFVAIILTDVASAQIIAYETGAFGGYETIPDWAAVVVVNMVVTLALFNVVIVTAFLVASPEAALMRAEARAKRIMRRAEVAAEIQRQNAAAKAFEQQAKTRAVTSGQQFGNARAAQMFANDTDDVANPTNGNRQ